MIKVVSDEEHSDIIRLKDVQDNVSIFAYKPVGKLVGMLVHENEGWIVKIGSAGGATGYHFTRNDCIKSCIKYGFEFYIEDNK